MFELMDAYSQSAVIKVIGVGGGGGNAVAHMVTSGIDGVEFMCINTDSQALKHAKVKTALQIGCNITKGLGAGADPEVGRQAAMEDRDRIVEAHDGVGERNTPDCGPQSFMRLDVTALFFVADQLDADPE